MPFAPPALRAQVNVVEVRVAVIAPAQPPDEVQMVLQDDRIVHVGDGERSAAGVIRDELPSAEHREPPRVIRVAGARRAAHDAEGQLLAGLMAFLQHAVEEFGVDPPGLRLQVGPTPAGVLQRRGDPPRQALVLPARLMESLPAHARIGQDLAGLLGANREPLRHVSRRAGKLADGRGRRLRGPGRRNHTGEQQANKRQFPHAMAPGNWVWWRTIACPAPSAMSSAGWVFAGWVERSEPHHNSVADSGGAFLRSTHPTACPALPAWT